MDAKPLKRPTLLILGRDLTVSRNIRKLFHNHFNALLCTSSTEALAIAQVRRVHVFICIQQTATDEKDGVDVLRRVGEVSPHTSQILMAALSDFDKILDAVNRGDAFRVINKPWKVAKLKAAVYDLAKQSLQQNHQAQQSQSEDESEGSGQQKILVLDSDGDTCKITRSAVADNAQIYDARTLRRAIHIFNREPISILVTELQIGGTDITKALAQIKESKPGLLILAVTANKDVASLLNLMNQGMIFRYLPKPVSSRLMQKTLATAMRRLGLVLEEA